MDADIELGALGATNLSAGVLQGFPVSCSGSRTSIIDAMGGRTQVHSLVTVAVVLAVLLGGRGVLSAFPVPALGALVIYAALRLVGVAEFRRIASFRRSEAVPAATTVVAVLGLGLGVLYGVFVAVALSVLDLLRRIARAHDAILGFVPDMAGMHDIDDYPQARPLPGLVIYRYDAPLCFANAEDFRQRAAAAVDSWAQRHPGALVGAQRRSQCRSRSDGDGCRRAPP